MWDKVSRIWAKFVNRVEYEEHFAIYLRLTPVTFLSKDYYVSLHGFWTGEQVDGLMVIVEFLSEVDETPVSSKIDYVPFEGWIEASSGVRPRYSSHCMSRFGMESRLEEGFFDLLRDGAVALSDYQVSGEDAKYLRTYRESLGEDDYMLEDDAFNYGQPTEFMFLAPAGGAISYKDSDWSAFPWRNAQYLFVTCVRWMNDFDESNEFANDWIEKLTDKAEGFLGKASFVNFPDQNLFDDDYEHRYYGDNYERLQEIKAKYDSKNQFQNPEGVYSSTQSAALSSKAKYKRSRKSEKYPKKEKLPTLWQQKHAKKQNIQNEQLFVDGG